MKLILIHADGSKTTVDAAREMMLVGRSPECDVQLKSSRVSRKHAEIRCFNDCFYIKDMGSAAGTSVAGRALSAGEACELMPGTTVTLADCQIVLRDTAEEVVAAPPVTTPEEKPAFASTPIAETPAPHPPKYEGIPPEVQTVLSETCAFYTASTTKLVAEFREEIRERLNLKEDQGQSLEELRAKVKVAIHQILVDEGHRLPLDVPKDRFAKALMDSVIDYGPITPLLEMDVVSEVMVNGPDCIFIEAKGKMYETGITFSSEDELMMVIRRIVEPIGRHVDDASPMVDARLPDGSRVNAVIRPLSLGGAALTIRKFKKDQLTVSELCQFGSLTPAMAEFLQEAVHSKQNIVVSGGTGSGKTTLLNVLSHFIPEGERVITVEDAAELQLTHRNLVRMEARPANIEGKGRVTIRDLVVNTLRMRPDRIIVGECRGPEALDMLQAMNTGHDGSLTTLHANNPREALTRLENMVMMAGYDLPMKAIREQIASAVKLIVQQTRLPDGSRKIVRIEEIDGIEGETILTTPIFEFVEQRGGDSMGYHRATQNIPKFITALKEANKLNISLSVFAQ